LSQNVSLLAGVGAYLPAQRVTNAELAARIDTSDDWIVERTGIRERRIAAADEKTSDLAIAAARAALANAKISADQVDLIIVATATPDLTFPATATKVQRALGVLHGFAFDMQAVCSGFVYALATADNFLARGQARTALVIGAETFSRILDWTDRTTCVLFGDGAGAVVLTAATAQDAKGRGVLSTYLRSDGRFHDLLYVDGGPSQTQTVGHLKMDGRGVFRHAVDHIAEAIGEACKRADVPVAAVDWFVPHQANQRILDGVAKRLAIPPAKVISTIAEHGNTSAASVPLALAQAVGDGRIKPGQLVVLEAMGGGLTWGAAAIRL
jgi:3-oxoacyl-[acyl-carrier-protein] synthase III